MPDIVSSPRRDKRAPPRSLVEPHEAVLDVTADGEPLTQVPGLYSTYWTSTGTSSGQTIARATPIIFNSFGVFFTS